MYTSGRERPELYYMLIEQTSTAIVRGIAYIRYDCTYIKRTRSPKYGRLILARFIYIYMFDDGRAI